MVTMPGVALMAAVVIGVALMVTRAVMAGVRMVGMAVHPTSFGGLGMAGARYGRVCTSRCRCRCGHRLSLVVVM
ncbi:hypothetical protein W823_05940 [Williamsia sp. D3]|nr:hypothetical protein W823_05940 [Williamsia sp. D3]